MLHKIFSPSSNQKLQKQDTLIGYLKVKYLYKRPDVVSSKKLFTSSLHTGKDDDIVKLYDLSSLCSDMNEDANQNPFTTPVAMLLFKY